MSAVDQRTMLASYIEAVSFDGWGDEGVASTANQLNTTPFEVRRALGQNPTLRQDAFFTRIESDMAQRVHAIANFTALPVREKVYEAVMAWFGAADAFAGGKLAVKKAATDRLFSCRIVSAATRQWRLADAIWRLCGDNATDFNHYTKRGILSGVFASALTYWVHDRSENGVKTQEFLRCRIADALKIGGAAAKCKSVFPWAKR